MQVNAWLWSRLHLCTFDRPTTVWTFMECVTVAVITLYVKRTPQTIVIFASGEVIASIRGASHRLSSASETITGVKVASPLDERI